MKHEVRVRFSIEPDVSEEDPEFVANVIAVGMQRSLFLAGFSPTHGITVQVGVEPVTVHSDLVPEVAENDLPI